MFEDAFKALAFERFKTRFSLPKFCYKQRYFKINLGKLKINYNFDGAQGKNKIYSPNLFNHIVKLNISSLK